MARSVSVFFYGSFINLDVLAEVDIRPERVTVAKLRDWDIVIRPLATIEPVADRLVYGIVVECMHAELERLYGQDWVGTYLPEAVLVEDSDGKLLPALTYVKWEYEQTPAASDYVKRIANPAASYGFPEWYLDRLYAYERGD